MEVGWVPVKQKRSVDGGLGFLVGQRVKPKEGKRERCSLQLPLNAVVSTKDKKKGGRKKFETFQNRRGQEHAKNHAEVDPAPRAAHQAL